MKTFNRPLYDNRLVQHFVENILDISKNDPQFNEAISDIVSAEIQNDAVMKKPTLTFDNYRHPSYINEEDRIILRKQIFEELIQFERPENDDSIQLGHGGALPRRILPLREKKAFLVIGLPASGKSGVSNKISDTFGGIILDSDFAKRKFPEYINNFGASVLHEESSELIFGTKSKDSFNLLDYCILGNLNIVIPKIGHDYCSILKFANVLKDKGYENHLILVNLDRKISTVRAYKRYIDTKRYVPLSLIFDSYSNEPTLTFYRIKNHVVFTTYCKISTESNPSILVDTSENNPLTCIL